MKIISIFRYNKRICILTQPAVLCRFDISLFAQTLVQGIPFVASRDPLQFTEPDVFNPERWIRGDLPSTSAVRDQVDNGVVLSPVDGELWSRRLVDNTILYFSSIGSGKYQFHKQFVEIFQSHPLTLESSIVLPEIADDFDCLSKYVNYLTR